ncbi:MAG: hypothetical protein PHX68_00920 [Alphaproteobacteria bacterium]|nr:hypothetical protein [Alphaproteobacteria bacterium]
MGGVLVFQAALFRPNALSASPLPNPGGVSPIVDSVSPYGSPTYTPEPLPGPRTPQIDLPLGRDEEAPTYYGPLDPSPSPIPNPGGVSPIVDSLTPDAAPALLSKCDEGDARCSQLIKVFCLYSVALAQSMAEDAAQLRQQGGQKNLPSLSGALNLSASIARKEKEVRSKFQADFDAAYQNECISGGLCGNICRCDHGEKCMEGCATIKSTLCETLYNSFYKTLVPSELLNEAPTGKMEMPTCQGSAGNCRTLSTIEAILQTPEGQKIIEESLRVNEDGSVDVVFKGDPTKTYHIMPTDLLTAETSGQFSRGDADMRALELAVKQYFDNRGVSFENISGFELVRLQSLLLGKTGGNLMEQVQWNQGWNQERIMDSFNDPGMIRTTGIAANQSTFKPQGDKIQVYDHNSGQNVNLLTEHEYSIVGSDKNFVYIKNPHDATTPIAISRSDFKKINQDIAGKKIQ